MLQRLLPIFKKHIFFLIVIVGLVVTSSVTTGKISNVTSVLAGIVMIYAGISFAYWIIKTPSKKSKEEVA